MISKRLKVLAYFFGVVILGLGLSFFLQPILADWSAPSATPPASNVDQPLNVGTTTQSKTGVLNTNGLSIMGGLTVWVKDLFVDVTNHRVGVGTATPAATLDVAGKLNLKSNGVNSGELKVGFTASAPTGYYATYAP